MSEEPNPSSPTISAMKMRKPALNKAIAKRLYIALAIAAVLTILIYTAWLIFGAGKQETDDAEVHADVVQVAARVAGQIIQVDIGDNQRVKKGQLIAEIDPSDAKVKLDQAQAGLETARAQAAEADAKVGIIKATAHGGLNAATAAVESAREAADSAEHAIDEAQAAVAKAKANADRARLDFDRAVELGDKGDISRSQVDAARAANDSAKADLDQAEARLRSSKNARDLAKANLRQARGHLQQSSPVGAQIDAVEAAAQLAHARVKAAKAAVEAAKLMLSWTKIVAPADGIASKLSVHPGTMVAPGQPVIQLVPLETYVIANFKETQMKNIHPGQRAVVEVDTLGGKNFEGKVESISGGTGASFSLLPPDNASGNFVKVVQRIPVRISWEGPPSDQIAVGSSTEVTVYTK